MKQPLTLFNIYCLNVNINIYIYIIYIYLQLYTHDECPNITRRYINFVEFITLIYIYIHMYIYIYINDSHVPCLQEHAMMIHPQHGHGMMQPHGHVHAQTSKC